MWRIWKSRRQGAIGSFVTSIEKKHEGFIPRDLAPMFTFEIEPELEPEEPNGGRSRKLEQKREQSQGRRFFDWGELCWPSQNRWARGQAAAYHANEFTSAEQSYITQSGQVRGETPQLTWDKPISENASGVL